MTKRLFYNVKTVDCPRCIDPTEAINCNEKCKYFVSKDDTSVICTAGGSIS